jgi:hypothetical protein
MQGKPLAPTASLLRYQALHTRGALVVDVDVQVLAAEQLLLGPFFSISAAEHSLGQLLQPAAVHRK